MIFIMNAEGTVTTAVSSPLYQGSDDVNEIVLLAPFATNTVVMVSFRLPNGQYVYPYFAGNENSAPYTATVIESLEGKFFAEDGTTGYNAWLLKVDYPLTQFSGELDIQFMLTLASGGYLTSSVPMVTVGRGIPYLPPSIADDEALGTLHTAVTSAQAAQGNAENAAAQANDAASRASGSADNAAESEQAATSASQSATHAAYSYGQAYQEAFNAADSARLAQEALDEITGVIGGVYRFKGSVQNYSDLPSGATVGDVYNVVNEATVNGMTYGAGTNFAWDGTAWDALGGVGGGSSVDLSNYYAKPSTTPSVDSVVPATDTFGDTVYIPVDGPAGDISDNGLVRRLDGGISLPYQDESVITDDNSEAVSGQAVYAYVEAVVGDISSALTELHTYAQSFVNGGVV